jgi:hypothetical protein
MKKSIIFDELQGRVKMMSIYRASDAPPDWLQEDPNHPGYIHNKPEFVAGDNIEITQEGRSIIISAKGTVFPDEPDQPDVPDVPVTPDEPSEEGSIIERIIINKIPAFLGVGEVKLKEYQLLDGKTAEYTDEGFYVAMEDGIVKTAGYQLTLEGTEDEDVGHTMLILSDAKIVNAYQYLPAME